MISIMMISSTLNCTRPAGPEENRGNHMSKFKASMVANTRHMDDEVVGFSRGRLAAKHVLADGAARRPSYAGQAGRLNDRDGPPLRRDRLTGARVPDT